MATVAFDDGTEKTVGNVYCIGRNYTAHIAELNNQAESEPVVFLKPTTALQRDDQAIRLPAFSNDVHYETELVMLIGKGGRHIDESVALSHVEGYAVGLDLTARDVQQRLKTAGLPWTVAKGFEGAACISSFLAADICPDPETLHFSLYLNGVVRQQGDVRQMLFGLRAQIAYLSTVFRLEAGDLIYTGTPAGVGPLCSGDVLGLHLAGQQLAVFTVA